MSAGVKKIALNALYIAVVVGAVFAIWAVAASIVDKPLILPTAGEVFSALGEVIRLPSFRTGLCGTIIRSLIGYAISVAIALGLFCLSALSSVASGIITPVVSAFRTLPTIAVSLVLAIWAGAQAAPVILGVLVIAPSLYSSLRARAATVDRELVEVTRLYGAGRIGVLRYVVMPAAAAALPEALSANLSFCIKIVIAAEIVMQTASGLGMLMSAAQMYYMTATLIALVLVAVVLSVAFEYAVRGVLTIALRRYADR